MSAEAYSSWGASKLREIAAGIPPLVSESSPASDELEVLKGQFLASLNHEIRTPLSGLIGMADLLAETSLSGEQAEFLSGIRECAGQLLEILNSVLDYSAISAGQMRMQETEFHLLQVLESVAAESHVRAEAKGLRMKVDLEDGLPETAIGDPRLLRQVVTHLLRNAVKFTNRGSIELRAGYEGMAGRRFMLVVQVADTGIGIAPEMLHLLFESFRQLEGGLARRHAGLGLGLALVDRVVRMMKGKIEVSSEPGQGSQFTLRVPLRVPASAEVKPAARLAVTGRRILVVDDNKIAQHVVGHILGRAGFEIEFADGGEEAIRRAASSHFDLILMDLQMPGVDGLTAARQIRTLNGYGDVPVIALTANYSDEYRLVCAQNGLNGFLCKPFQKDELLRTVQELLQ